MVSGLMIPVACTTEVMLPFVTGGGLIFDVAATALQSEAGGNDNNQKHAEKRGKPVVVDEIWYFHIGVVQSLGRMQFAPGFG